MRIRLVFILLVLTWTTPSPPPLYGEWLVWDCPYGYDSYIYLSRPDGSEITRLSRHREWLDDSGGAIVDQDPHWSINGRAITYSYLDELYRMAVDGSGKQIILQFDSPYSSRILTHAPSPDGQWIVVIVDNRRMLDDTDKDDLYLVSADGSESLRLAVIDPALYRWHIFETRHSRRIRATWSKDGKMITLEPIRRFGVLRRGIQVDITNGSIAPFWRFEQADIPETRFKQSAHFCTEPSRVDVFQFTDE